MRDAILRMQESVADLQDILKDDPGSHELASRVDNVAGRISSIAMLLESMEIKFPEET